MSSARATSNLGAMPEKKASDLEILTDQVRSRIDELLDVSRHMKATADRVYGEEPESDQKSQDEAATAGAVQDLQRAVDRLQGAIQEAKHQSQRLSNLA